MAGLRVPLSTLRPRPRGHQRMTRGQDGSLLLACTAVASATPCRFIPALTPTPLSPNFIGWFGDGASREIPGLPASLRQFSPVPFRLHDQLFQCGVDGLLAGVAEPLI